jgi:hypothetical protein
VQTTTDSKSQRHSHATQCARQDRKAQIQQFKTWSLLPAKCHCITQEQNDGSESTRQFSTPVAAIQFPSSILCKCNKKWWFKSGHNTQQHIWKAYWNILDIPLRFRMSRSWGLNITAWCLWLGVGGADSHRCLLILFSVAAKFFYPLCKCTTQSQI